MIVYLLTSNDYKITQNLFIIMVCSVWLGGVMVRAVACDSRGRGFDARPFHC